MSVVDSKRTAYSLPVPLTDTLDWVLGLNVTGAFHDIPPSVDI